MKIEIRQITQRAELETVFRLRYQIYVEEMGDKAKYANHQLKMIEEPLDDQGTILGAFDDGTLLGSLRLNWGFHNIGHYADYYSMRSFGSYFPERTTFTTKLVVHPEYRHSPVAIRLAIEGFKIYCNSRACFDLVDCKANLRPFFLKLGYRQVFSDVVHPECGDIHHPMVLVTGDREHLERVHSPFRRVLDQLPTDPASVEFFNSHVLQKSTVAEMIPATRTVPPLGRLNDDSIT
jgi:hypothetical protein